MQLQTIMYVCYSLFCSLPTFQKQFSLSFNFSFVVRRHVNKQKQRIYTDIDLGSRGPLTTLNHPTEVLGLHASLTTSKLKHITSDFNLSPFTHEFPAIGTSHSPSNAKQHIHW